MAARARVREGVSYFAEGGLKAAPRGDYDLRAEKGGVSLVSPATSDAFRLSDDAFCRLLAEGRITLID